MAKRKKSKKTPQAAALHGYPTLSAAVSGHTASLSALSADKALTLSAVWACVRLLAQTVSTLPLKIFRYDGHGGKEAVESGHYLQQLLTVRPNMQQTPCKMLEFLMASLCLRGNAYFEKRMIGSRTLALLPILPQHLISVLPDGKGVYQYTFWRDNVRHTLPEQQIWHIRGFGTDGFFGINPLTAAAASLQQALSADKTAGSLFAGGMTASGFIRYNNGFLNAEQRKGLNENLKMFMGSENAGKVMVLEAGMEYQGITIDPVAAQLLETRTFGVEEICRWFGVPPVLIGHTSKSSSWGASIEALFQLFVATTLRPLLVNIEQSIKKDLIVPSERQSVLAEFNAEGLLRGDTAARTAYYTAAVNNGWLTRNEVRSKENLPAIDGGDTATVQAALIPLQDVGINFSQGAQPHALP